MKAVLISWHDHGDSRSVLCTVVGMTIASDEHFLLDFRSYFCLRESEEIKHLYKEVL